MKVEAGAHKGDSIRFRLRAATSALHLETEQIMDLDRRAATRDGYRDLVARLYGFYRPLENVLRSLAWPPDFRATERLNKSDWLREDLVRLGMNEADIAALPQRAQRSRNEGGEGLGVLYVVEGATLGGQVIRRMLEQRLGIGPDNGGRFFASYGPSIGAMWQGLIAELDRHTDQECMIEAAAAETFASFGEWLRPLGPT